MSTDIAIPEEVSSDVVDIEHLDTPEKRFMHLSRSFTSAIIVIAEMQKQRDWENLTHDDGTPYKSLTDMVQDALKISDSYARRLVQTSNAFYTPLEAVTVEGTVISITAAEAVKLGSEGMSEVVNKVEERIGESDAEDPDFQSNLIDEVKGEVLRNKEKGAILDDFDEDDFPDDIFDDDLLDDDFDNDDDDFDTPKPNSSKSKSSDTSNDFDDDDFEFPEDNDSPPAPEPSKKKDDKKQTPSDYLGPIEKIMSGGKEYKTDEDIEELPEELQEFVRAVNYLAGLDSVALSEMITSERRGVTYSIRKAASNLTLVVSATETSSWVLEQI